MRRFYRISELARAMGLSYDVIYAAFRKGELKGIQHKGYKGRKGAILVAPEEWDRWIAENFQTI